MLFARRLIVVGAVLVVAASGIAFAQTAQHVMPVDHAAMHAGTIPTMPGQDAFGAIQEIVQMLAADPKTDWSKVNLEALRQHLLLCRFAMPGTSGCATLADFEISQNRF